LWVGVGSDILVNLRCVGCSMILVFFWDGSVGFNDLDEFLGFLKKRVSSTVEFSVGTGSLLTRRDFIVRLFRFFFFVTFEII